MIPIATMRLQLHRDFTFNDAAAVVPYLVDLGISHVYLSPILSARAGSIHGYDVVDPTSVNPELGGEPGFIDLVGCLRKAGLGLIVDIVPNHMAVGTADNPWWTDMLRHGRKSRYADFFDVDWEPTDSDLQGKVLAPFLGNSYGEALEAGEIQLKSSESGAPAIYYFDSEFPIDPIDHVHITEHGIESFRPDKPEGRALLHDLLERQHYRLAWWGTAGDEINWRRFFDINGLAGLRIEVPEVFEETHATLFRLYREGLIDGFRIDHVDGLSDPPGYCRRLRQRLEELGPDRQAYLVIEKILGVDEFLPTDWQVNGTSGYDFMDQVNAVQHDASNAGVLGEIWHTLAHRPAQFEIEEVGARREILEYSFNAQLEVLTSALHQKARADVTTRDISAARIRNGLVALLTHFPVYRGYNAGSTRSAADQAAFGKALAGAKCSAPQSLYPVLDQLDRWLGGEPGNKVAVTRLQQLSAPVAAKAVEDTAFYRYGRLLSRNDVGFNASLLGCSVADFHATCIQRLATFPNAMLATATHDHKRGEDLRARLAVISEIPEEWNTFLRQCRAVEAKRPDPADEIMLYQMVVGAWPLDLDPANEKGRKEFQQRMDQWFRKALREAKLRSSWTSPNEAYEKISADFLADVLRSDSALLPIISAFVERIAPAGAVNGLVQALLKLTVPGMPDFFQGTEFWDFSLVDPDNRRAVDFAARRLALEQSFTYSQLQACWRDGRIKQAIIHALLGLRSRLPGVFAAGEYVPITVVGPLHDRIVAFARHLGQHTVLVTAPRLVLGCLSDSDAISIDPGCQIGSSLLIPEALRGRLMRSLFSTSDPILLQEKLQLNLQVGELPLSVIHT